MMNYILKPILDHLKMSMTEELNDCSTHRLTTSPVSCAALFQMNSASAIGLLQAYEEALQNDPPIARQFMKQSGSGIRGVIGRAGLLPMLSANYT